MLGLERPETLAPLARQPLIGGAEGGLPVDVRTQRESGSWVEVAATTGSICSPLQIHNRVKAY